MGNSVRTELEPKEASPSFSPGIDVRSVPEWRGKTDDAKVPPRVRLRVFQRANGICHLSGRKIETGEVWHVEHIKALANGGEHRESNMAPALVAPHKAKTREDRREKARVDARAKSHAGITGPKAKIPQRLKTRKARKLTWLGYPEWMR